MSALGITRHEIIAQHRANGLDWTECYKLAGYKGKDPADRIHKTLSRYPVIHERVKELLEIRAHASTTMHQYGKAEVISGLLRNARLGQTPLGVNNNKGEDTGNVKFDLTASNRAFELLGMELGMFPKLSKLQHGKLDPLEGLQQGEVLKLAQQVMGRMGVEIDIEMLGEILAMKQAEAAQHRPAGPVLGTGK